MRLPDLDAPAQRAWADALARWAIPAEILAAAPESPWGFPPRLFAPAATTGDTPSRRAALDALPAGGSVLDVGCGAGAAGYALVPPASRVAGVDESPAMLETFAGEGIRRGIPHTEVCGRWPDVAGSVAAADVVVCHHVAYNVSDLGPFVLALTSHASRRVVVEITAVHPQATLAPLWRQFWHLERPAGPTATDFLAVVREVGLDPRSEESSRPPRWHAGGAPPAEHPPGYVEWVRRRLCLPADRDGEVAAALTGLTTASLGVVTVWWAGHPSGSSSGRDR